MCAHCACIVVSVFFVSSVCLFSICQFELHVTEFINLVYICISGVWAILFCLLSPFDVFLIVICDTPLC